MDVTVYICVYVEELPDREAPVSLSPAGRGQSGEVYGVSMLWLRPRPDDDVPCYKENGFSSASYPTDDNLSYRRYCFEFNFPWIAYDSIPFSYFNSRGECYYERITAMPRYAIGHPQPHLLANVGQITGGEHKSKGTATDSILHGVFIVAFDSCCTITRSQNPINSLIGDYPFKCRQMHSHFVVGIQFSAGAMRFLRDQCGEFEAANGSKMPVMDAATVLASYMTDAVNRNQISRNLIKYTSFTLAGFEGDVLVLRCVTLEDTFGARALRPYGGEHPIIATGSGGEHALLLLRQLFSDAMAVQDLYPLIRTAFCYAAYKDFQSGNTVSLIQMTAAGGASCVFYRDSIKKLFEAGDYIPDVA